MLAFEVHALDRAARYRDPGRLDPDFLPYLLTPSFPSYPSGHASVSGAAAAVLSTFSPGEQARFRTLAEEAAMSRLYGGIQFRNDNEEGLRLGYRVGEIDRGTLPYLNTAPSKMETGCGMLHASLGE